MIAQSWGVSNINESITSKMNSIPEIHFNEYKMMPQILYFKLPFVLTRGEVIYLKGAYFIILMKEVYLIRMFDPTCV